MNTHARVSRFLAPLSLVLMLLLLTVLVAPSAASLLPAPTDPASSAMAGARSTPEAGLTAVDVPESAQPVLDRLAIVYQEQAHDGLMRGAATAGQLAALDREGVAYRTIGKVAIFEGGGQEGSPGLGNPSCVAENYNNIPISTSSYVYDDNFTGCYPNGTVNWVDIHFIITNAYFGAYSGGRLAEIYVNFGRNSPSWAYTNVGEYWRSCAVSSPPRDGQVGLEDTATYDRWLFDVDATMGTNIFSGIPLNQRWDLAAYHPCPGSPTAYIYYWGVWAYYTPFPMDTPTTTRTPTPTFTRTPTGVPPLTATRTATPTATRTQSGGSTATPTRSATPTRTPTQHGPWPRRIWLPLILQSW